RRRLFAVERSGEGVADRRLVALLHGGGDASADGVIVSISRQRLDRMPRGGVWAVDDLPEQKRNGGLIAHLTDGEQDRALPLAVHLALPLRHEQIQRRTLARLRQRHRRQLAQLLLR